MRYLSVCSGIEAASVAWKPLGWECAAMSEIEKFPRAVLKHHYPDTPLHGDFTTIKGEEYGTIDLLVGGTPCQPFSVAGLRGGLADYRGNLALEFCKLALRTRPTWVVWENVPGVLSSNEGKDFGSFLGALAECGYGFAYRVLDAQFVRVQSHAFAVPQRRRRVFVVGYLGDWRRAAQVLFERESMCGHPSPRREAGQRATGKISSRTTGGGGLGTDFEIGGGLVAGTLKNAHSVNGDPEQLVASPIRTRPYGDNASQESQLVVDDVSHCLNTGGMGRQDWETESFVAFAKNSRDEVRMINGDGSVAGALSAEPSMKQQTFVSGVTIHGTDKTAKGQHPTCVTSVSMASDPIHSRELAQPITCRNGDAGTIQQGSAVRRLTPRECEKLQGFPPGYTNVIYRNKPACDGPRYKAIGNSMAVNVMSWIGQRIESTDSRNP